MQSLVRYNLEDLGIESSHVNDDYEMQHPPLYPKGKPHLKYQSGSVSGGGSLEQMQFHANEKNYLLARQRSSGYFKHDKSEHEFGNDIVRYSDKKKTRRRLLVSLPLISQTRI